MICGDREARTRIKERGEDKENEDERPEDPVAGAWDVRCLYGEIQ